MAYISQDRKKKIAPQIKKVLAKFGYKGTIGVRNHSTLTVKLKSGPATLKPDAQINPYHYAGFYEDQPEFVKFMDELVTAIKSDGFFDHSDMQTDYFHTDFYYGVDVRETYVQTQN